ncbi:MAG: D-alanyl-D-alanine carboxypeptidase family protein [Eubacteriales bacterium]|nr:D-alanyl-D-alanine carboxypeptidase family protein [Eubacteriales bacterium]
MRDQKKTILFLIILAALFSAIQVPAYALDAPRVKAEAIVLADMDSGVILYEKNMNQMRSPASLTKIMTGLLAVEAIERGDIALDDIITAPSNCWDGMDLDSSNAEILPGEKMTFKDYLYCAMVKSANEACNVIAVTLDGSIQGFVNRMNLRANELGANHTYFSDTNGLSNENHYTTAYDLFLITLEAMKHELFVDAVNTIDYEIEETNMHAKRYLNSSNALLCQDGLYGDGYLYLPASGVKTGYTNAAGYCLVSTAEKKDMRLLAVVLGCGGVMNTGEEGYGNFSSTISLYDWGFSNFEKINVTSMGKIVNRAPVKFAKDNATVGLRAVADIGFLAPKDLDKSRISAEISLDESKLVAPIRIGDILGTVTVKIDRNHYASAKLYSAENIEADKKELIKAELSELFSRTEVKIISAAIFALLVLIIWITLKYKTEKKRHMSEIADAEERRRRERELRENMERNKIAREQIDQYRQKEN